MDAQLLVGAPSAAWVPGSGHAGPDPSITGPGEHPQSRLCGSRCRAAVPTAVLCSSLWAVHLHSIFAFDVASRARGVAIHSTPRNGRSLLPYAADSTIFLDGEPKGGIGMPTSNSQPLFSDMFIFPPFQLVDYGHDGCLLMLQVCLDEVLLNDREAKNLQLKHDLLSSTFRYCLDKTYFSTCFCEALMRIKTATDGLLETLSSVLELSAAEKVGIGLALSDSDNSGMKLKGQQFAIAQIEELCLNPDQSIPNDQIHEIIVFLHQTDGLPKHMDTFSNIASFLEVGQSPFFAPIPKEQYDAQSINPSRHLEMYLDSTNDDFESLLSEIGKEISMADIVIELGYGCTVDSTQCKEILSTFQPLDDLAISKLLGAVIGTQNSLGEAHNTYATFVSAIRNTHLSESPQFLFFASRFCILITWLFFPM
ncbi:uncharacterized protein LOC123408030 [Hordeum vulgare subsp. vulgare]|uniref:uncharacterized protein LOC123408030 n=1 Tax=Hordeum vulgare subsp. vulgare TaxID=112509 RepID=UPI001D1A40D7|nr:uncharacterized protein LOC123408030 [Hordeum vulgare subsp. vulgare]